MLITQRYGTVVPSLHLQQLNPHIDASEVLFPVEQVQLEGLSSYHGLSGRSVGGTMCHVITLGNVQRSEPEEAREEPAVEPAALSREAQQLAASTYWLAQRTAFEAALSDCGRI